LEWMKKTGDSGVCVDEYGLFRELDRREELLQYRQVYDGKNRMDLRVGMISHSAENEE
jgi:hypothetical protein